MVNPARCPPRTKHAAPPGVRPGANRAPAGKPVARAHEGMVFCPFTEDGLGGAAYLLPTTYYLLPTILLPININAYYLISG